MRGLYGELQLVCPAALEFSRVGYESHVERVLDGVVLPEVKYRPACGDEPDGCEVDDAILVLVYCDAAVCADAELECVSCDCECALSLCGEGVMEWRCCFRIEAGLAFRARARPELRSVVCEVRAFVFDDVRYACRVCERSCDEEVVVAVDVAGGGVCFDEHEVVVFVSECESSAVVVAVVDEREVVSDVSGVVVCEAIVCGCWGVQLYGTVSDSVGSSVMDVPVRPELVCWMGEECEQVLSRAQTECFRVRVVVCAGIVCARCESELVAVGDAVYRELVAGLLCADLDECVFFSFRVERDALFELVVCVVRVFEFDA